MAKNKTLEKITVTRALEQNLGLLKAMLGADAFEWVVVWTNPSCEARALASIERMGRIAWLPMRAKVRKPNGRIKVEIDDSAPLFPRYLFVAFPKGGAPDTQSLRGCDGVENFLSLSADGAPAVVKGRDMLRILEESAKTYCQPNYVVPQMLEIGSKIMIATGVGIQIEALVSAYDVARGKVDAQADGLGGKVNVSAPVDRCRLVA